MRAISSGELTTRIDVQCCGCPGECNSICLGCTRSDAKRSRADRYVETSHACDRGSVSGCTATNIRHLAGDSLNTSHITDYNSCAVQEAWLRTAASTT